MYDNVAVVGATGAVGTLIIRMLQERKFPYKKMKFLASKRSAGRSIPFNDGSVIVEELCPEAFDGVDLVIASTPDDVARDFVPEARKRVKVIVDESGYWRMYPDVPLVIPEVNAEAIRKHKGLISSPNCSTTQMVVALKPLHDYARVRRVVVSTYQATSGAGLAGNRDLVNSSKAWLDNGCHYCECESETFPYPIGFNCIPQIGGERERGYTSEELKLLHETRKILGDSSIQVCPTAVRVPVANCHSESVVVETERKISVEKARELFRAMPGVVLMDDLKAKNYPTPFHCHDTDEVYVGRIREDISASNSLAFWCVSDNLRKGAATNAVQIAEWIQANL
ncbi:MAG: aspartate-semialdehyde dehydrogenase [Thermoguttaceae bacterium]|nr:aspartate-semialdehyde dehydrogenase [Thermoguttaceae bacterium]MBR4751032.1 aspartate-semialdehyde dehydrogenase [Thermoguttaceae bacterium]